MARKKVLIVDDSALMRQMLTQILTRDSGLEVVGSARDPYEAWDKIQETNPDVVTLDVEMPRMDGLAFLEKLMIARPLPVVMVSSLTEKGCQTTLRALELGAVDFVSKPKLDVRAGTLDLADEIVMKVNAASVSRPRPLCRRPARKTTAPPSSGALLQSTYRVIAIGASTGGTEALCEVLAELPPDSPGIVIVQHMPGQFTNKFAERLNRICRIQVREAKHGDRILPGLALLAPGGFQMEACRRGASYEVQITDAPPVNRFKPSVDVLFDSCARHIGKHTVGVILTGMGKDGAAGMRALYDVGCHTIAQDEKTSVVFGMPKEAIATGGVHEIAPLGQIAASIVTACQAPATKKGSRTANQTAVSS